MTLHPFRTGIAVLLIAGCASDNNGSLNADTDSVDRSSYFPASTSEGSKV
jgi:hypothetical protein